MSKESNIRAPATIVRCLSQFSFQSQKREQALHHQSSTSCLALPAQIRMPKKRPPSLHMLPRLKLQSFGQTLVPEEWKLLVKMILMISDLELDFTWMPPQKLIRSITIWKLTSLRSYLLS
tara:strand:- start:111 stop:470 length:360 start_codon:yes stop_codon:yes gene_type:complete